MAIHRSTKARRCVSQFEGSSPALREHTPEHAPVQSPSLKGGLYTLRVYSHSNTEAMDQKRPSSLEVICVFFFFQVVASRGEMQARSAHSPARRHCNT